MVLILKRRFLLIGFCAVLFAVLFIAASWRTPQFLFNPSAPASLQDESLAFLRDVVGFNLTDYEVVDLHFWPQLDVVSSNGLPLYLMQYDLKSPDDEAYVDILYTKSNSTYIHEPYFSVRSNTLFSPAYPSDKILNWTKSFLERYQNYQSNASYLLEMRQTLELVNHIQPMNITNGDTTLQIVIKQFSEQDIYTTLKLSPINPTARDLDKAVTFEFHNGVLLDFSDYYGISC